jgi:DNA polymerase III delta subunit
MIYIIFGEDRFRAHEKARELRGDDSKILEVPPASFDDIFRSAGTGSLFGKQRTVVVRNFFVNSEKSLIERLIKVLPDISKEVTLIFWEDGPWELTERETRPLRTAAQFLGFSLLRGEAVRTWIKERVKRGGGEIKDDAVYLLSSLVGSDLSRAASEIDKLIAAREDKAIDVGLVNSMVEGDIPIEVFALTDAIAAKNPSALSVLSSLLGQGFDPLRLLALLATLVRSILLVHDAGEDASAAGLGMHPFVFQRTKAAAKEFRYEELLGFHKKILATDVAIKTGRMDPGEAISVLVASFVSSRPA